MCAAATPFIQVIKSIRLATGAVAAASEPCTRPAVCGPDAAQAGPWGWCWLKVLDTVRAAKGVGLGSSVHPGRPMLISLDGVSVAKTQRIRMADPEPFDGQGVRVTD